MNGEEDENEHVGTNMQINVYFCTLYYKLYILYTHR